MTPRKRLIVGIVIPVFALGCGIACLLVSAEKQRQREAEQSLERLKSIRTKIDNLGKFKAEVKRPIATEKRPIVTQKSPIATQKRPIATATERERATFFGPVQLADFEFEFAIVPASGMTACEAAALLKEIDSYFARKRVQQYMPAEQPPPCG